MVAKPVGLGFTGRLSNPSPKKGISRKFEKQLSHTGAHLPRPFLRSAWPP